jgi:hypothetical protein
MRMRMRSKTIQKAFERLLWVIKEGKEVDVDAHHHSDRMEAGDGAPNNEDRRKRLEGVIPMFPQSSNP